MYKIMLADDEGIVIDSLKFIIEKEFGNSCTVEFAKTGRSVIELAENLFDQIKFPQASTQMRTFTDKSQKTVQPPEKKKSAEELEKERGKMGTMLLYVQYRQRSTWQGVVKWVEGDQEWKFFSELELFKIINQAIQ